MEDKKFELFYDVMKEMDKAYDLMVEYDSLPHNYGNYVLYQVESHMIDCIGRNAGITITKLADDFGKTRSACSQMVKKLRDKGWVEQVRNKENNRVYNLFLTEEGMSIFRNHAQFEYQCYKRGFEGLKAFTYEKLEIYLAIQRKINESFQRDVEESYDYFETDEK